MSSEAVGEAAWSAIGPTTSQVVALAAGVVGEAARRSIDVWSEAPGAIAQAAAGNPLALVELTATLNADAANAATRDDLRMAPPYRSHDLSPGLHENPALAGRWVGWAMLPGATGHFKQARACSHYGHKGVARPKTPSARREGEGGRDVRRDFATQRWPFSAATRRERVH